jgi:hypothetical protein
MIEIWMYLIGIVLVGVALSMLIPGVRQSFSDDALNILGIGDELLRALWFWPVHLVNAHAYEPRHSASRPYWAKNFSL